MQGTGWWARVQKEMRLYHCFVEKRPDVYRDAQECAVCPNMRPDMCVRAQVCAVCERDVCEMLIFKSDAHRAKAIKHCMQCGL